MAKKSKKCKQCQAEIMRRGDVRDPALAEEMAVRALGPEAYDCGDLTPQECANVRKGLRPCGAPWVPARGR